MSSTEDLQQAIQAARAGLKTEARDLLVQIVDADPRNETAWMWLAGVADSLEDRIIACENVLTINPENEKVRDYLKRLRHRQKSSGTRKNIEESARLLARARASAERNEIDAALRLATRVLAEDPGSEAAWLLTARLSSDLDKQIASLQKAYELNPSNPVTLTALNHARYLKSNPLSAAAHLEQLGRFDEALQVYQQLAAQTKNSRDFDNIYRQIIRIEGLQKENIRYIAPGSSITRLTFSWPALYISLALIQVGLNPLSLSGVYLWLGLPFVVLGSFLLSLAEIRSKHMIWQKLFDEHGDGSTFARLVTAATGWFLILVPHLLLVFDSLNRLRNFKIPPIPF